MKQAIAEIGRCWYTRTPRSKGEHKETYISMRYDTKTMPVRLGNAFLPMLAKRLKRGEPPRNGPYF